jgi:hypothetical protein
MKADLNDDEIEKKRLHIFGTDVTNIEKYKEKKYCWFYEKEHDDRSLPELKKVRPYLGKFIRKISQEGSDLYEFNFGTVQPPATIFYTSNCDFPLKENDIISTSDLVDHYREEKQNKYCDLITGARYGKFIDYDDDDDGSNVKFENDKTLPKSEDELVTLCSSSWVGGRKTKRHKKRRNKSKSKSS